MAFRFSGRFLCSGLFLFVALAPAPSLGAATTVACNPSPTNLKAKISEAEPPDFEDSQTFTNVPHTSVTFTQGGAVPTCVIVRFSAQVGASNGTNMHVRAVLDGATLALPPEVRFAFTADTSAARSYEFIFPSVAPGKHVLRMQYQSSNGSSMNISNRSTIVLYTR